jgi:UDP-glucose 4-epimerase
MRVLVTGAAGFIGSVVTQQLLESGHQVVAIDSLQHGHRAAVLPPAEFIQGDLLDADWLKSVLSSNSFDAVVHLAAEALIDESIRNPGLFFRVNVTGGLNLLDAMVGAGSSSRPRPPCTASRSLRPSWRTRRIDR